MKYIILRISDLSTACFNFLKNAPVFRFILLREYATETIHFFPIAVYPWIPDFIFEQGMV